MASTGVTVDQSGGDVYVVDTSGAGPPIDFTGAVHRFDNAGAYEATIDGSETPHGLLQQPPGRSGR